MTSFCVPWHAIVESREKEIERLQAEIELREEEEACEAIEIDILSKEVDRLKAIADKLGLALESFAIIGANIGQHYGDFQTEFNCPGATAGEYRAAAEAAKEET